MKKYLPFLMIALLAACTPADAAKPSASPTVAPAPSPTVALTQVATSAPTPGPPAATPLPALLSEDFDRPSVSSWAVKQCGAVGGASGELSQAAGHTGLGLALAYRFTDGRQCVAAGRALELPADAGAVGFWVQNPGMAQLALTLRDSSGQTLRYTLIRPLEAADPTDWYHLVARLAAPDSYSGGANDGVVHGAIRALAIDVSPLEAGAAGSIAIDDLAAWPSAPLYLDPAALTVVPAPPGVAELGDRLGVNAHFSSTLPDPGLRAAADAGFRWLRTDLTWRDLEREPGVYDFTRFDQIVSAADAAGMRVLFILDYGNAFHTGGARTPPGTDEAIDAFADYAGDVARHFAGRSIAYEIWNEPNTSSFWPPKPDPATYAQLADAAAQAIHEADPTAPVVMGGLSLFDFQFLRATLAEPHAASYTAISVHPYVDRPERLSELVAHMRGIIRGALPYQPPIWISEWGYSGLCPAPGPGVVVCDRQPQMVARELLSAWAQGLPLTVYYELRDRDQASSTDPEGHFGLLTSAGAPKPALAAVRALSAAAQGRRYAGLIPLAPSSLHAMRLDGARDIVVALWLDRPGEQIAIGLPPGTTAADALGQPLALAPDGGHLSLSLHESDGPVYLTFPKGAPAG